MKIRTYQDLMRAGFIWPCPRFNLLTQCLFLFVVTMISLPFSQAFCHNTTIIVSIFSPSTPKKNQHLGSCAAGTGSGGAQLSAGRIAFDAVEQRGEDGGTAAVVLGGCRAESTCSKNGGFHSHGGWISNSWLVYFREIFSRQMDDSGSIFVRYN